jgi:alpha-L-fucosidase 2
MKKLKFICALTALMLLGIGHKAQAVTYSENNLVFLCFGQSNMQGNGSPEAIDQQGIDTKRFKKMYAANSYGEDKLGKWTNAYPPLCREGCGLTPVDYFGRYLCDSLAEQYKIYVIVVAVAGCSMKLFDKSQYVNYLNDSGTADWLRNIANDYGGNPYGRLIELAKKAQEEVGVIAGILVHQGETDAYSDEWVNRTWTVYRNILSDLGITRAKEAPMLVGEVVNADQNGACAGANTYIKKLCDAHNTVHLISSAGCPAGSDNLHFTPEGYRMLGKRYGAKMFEILKDKGYVTKTSVPSIPQESATETSAQPAIYNLNGQQLYAPVHGLNIINGKKYFIQ